MKTLHKRGESVRESEVKNIDLAQINLEIKAEEE